MSLNTYASGAIDSTPRCSISCFGMPGAQCAWRMATWSLPTRMSSAVCGRSICFWRDRKLMPRFRLHVITLKPSNICPGDLLTKNFGVTRRGRVVFYDYDELCFLTDCNFRDMPQPTTNEQEIAAEPWFSVREHDIFPEEFLRFLAFPKPARAALLERHGDLFHPEFWRNVQKKLRAGELPEIFPYAHERRLTG